MPRVTFSHKWEWHMGRKLTKLFPAGYTGLITTDQYKQALEAGVLAHGGAKGARGNPCKAESDTGSTEESSAGSS
jgi:hypothetical protein